MKSNLSDSPNHQTAKEHDDTNVQKGNSPVRFHFPISQPGRVEYAEEEPYALCPRRFVKDCDSDTGKGSDKASRWRELYRVDHAQQNKGQRQAQDKPQGNVGLVS